MYETFVMRSQEHVSLISLQARERCEEVLHLWSCGRALESVGVIDAIYLRTSRLGEAVRACCSSTRSGDTLGSTSRKRKAVS